MNKINIGNSGEYFVAAELERKGFCVGVPMSNVKDFDMLVCNLKTNNQYALQVKTQINSNRWILSKKNELIAEDNVYYIFVNLNEQLSPSYYIVPSKIVAKAIIDEHNEWLKCLGKNNKKHNDNSIRIFEIKEEANKYLSKWDYLK